jgi:type I restriction-modification system DNA methylase subunit
MEDIGRVYRNNKLFSKDFLEKRLQGFPEWRIDNQDLKRLQKTLRELFDRALPSTSEAALEEELIRPILSDLLGFSYLVQPSTKIFQTHRQPDYALFGDEAERLASKAFDGEKRLFENALAVADAKAWEVDLNTVGPASQMHDYIIISGTRWGILTNGRTWRLYHHKTIHELDTFYEADLETLIKSPDLSPLKYFLLFFHARSLQPDGFADRVLEQSVDYARRVGEELKENVYEALRLLCRGFLEGNASLSSDDLASIHENALILLYRILFILYAESEPERELLPLSNVDYKERIGLCALKHEVAEQANWLTETHNLWSRLQDLFHLIHEGSERLGIYAYNGGLFDPERHPFLDRHTIGDRYLANALKLLTCTEIEGHRGFLDYSALDVRELGSIYEGLLEHKLIHKNGVLEWEKDRSKRKKTGSYYTPEYIVQYIVEQTIGPLINAVQENLKKDLEALNQKIKRARGENRKLLEQEKKTLLVNARERVLELKILDPAMGSGHFLVSACDYLARRIAELEASVTGKESEEDVQALKRMIAIRSLYGVDLNPLATELAKLSLWLHTVAKDRPLSFLNHHLRTGNSLIGARVKALGALPVPKKRKKAEESGQISFFEIELKKKLPIVIGQVVKFLQTPSDKVDQIRKKERIYNKILEVLRPFREIANVWASVYFSNEIEPKDYEEKLLFKLSHSSTVWQSEVRSQPWFVKAQAIAKEKLFFHWELEFPEVFYRETGKWKENPGFDAVIGNPPYVRQEQISENKPYLKNAFETYSGVADLYVYFYEQSHRILHHDGRFGMITSNKFIRAAYGESLRAFLADRTTVEQIIDFGDLPVFPEVSAYPCVFVSRHTPSVCQNPLYLRVTSLDFGDLASHVHAEAVELSSEALVEGAWRLVGKREHEVFEKIKRQSVSLSDWLADSYIRRGVLTGLNEAFFIDESTRDRLIAEDPNSAELIKPLVVGEDIKRYEIDAKDRYLIFTRRGVDIDRYPAIKRHLEAFKEELMPRPPDWDNAIQGLWPGRKAGSYEWYEIQDTVDYYADFEKPKIIFGRFMDQPLFGFDIEGKYFTNDAMYIAAVPSGYPVTALNSQIGWFWLKSKCTDLRGRYIQVFIQDLAVFPIRRIAFVTPAGERARLVEEGKCLYVEALTKPNGAQDTSPRVFDALLHFVDEWLNKQHTSDPELVAAHNADPKNKDWQLDSDARWEQADVIHDLLAFLAEQMTALNREKQQTIKAFLNWLEAELEISSNKKGQTGIEALTGKTKLKNYLGDVQENEDPLTFDALWEILRKNKSRIGRSLSPTFMQTIKAAYEESLAKLLPLKERLRLTDALIDQIVYRLYGLTEEEIWIVEGKASE